GYRDLPAARGRVASPLRPGCLNRLYASFHLSGPTTEVSAHSAGHEKVPRVWPFNATEIDPDIRELLSMHCSWCVLDCGEAQWCYTVLLALRSPRRAFLDRGRSARRRHHFPSVEVVLFGQRAPAWAT